MDIKPSLFHIFSLGYVVEDNHKDCYCKPIVKVLPLEYLNNEDINNMLFNIRREYSETEDKDIVELVNNEKVKIKVKKLIEANKDMWNKVDDNINIERQRWIAVTWLNFVNNREYNPPCVNKGDIVIIYKYGNMNSYFWEILFKRTIEEHKTGDGSFKRYVESNPKKEKIEKEVTTMVCTNDISYRVHCNNYTTNIFNYLEMINGELNYIDQKGNMFSINQNGDINLRAMNNVDILATKDIYLNSTNMELMPSDKLSVSTKTIVMEGKNGVAITGNSSLTLKSVAITLQGNVVVNGNMVVTGTVTPAGCPCCCICPAGGGGGSNISTPKPNNNYKSANDNLNNRFNNVIKEKDNLLNKLKQHIKDIVKSITDKIGVGN